MQASNKLDISYGSMRLQNRCSYGIMKRDMNVKSNRMSGIQNYKHHLGNEGVSEAIGKKWHS
ncbi:hypothetical protein TSUD_128770 [Trifolium subterraneum]|uniref:Uncharacterized protein n=1 Tax=Trifolium subterraneum TaxID=3900 RepID=A0A2Z6MED6_TRISU|nr:hypothetical protein TSUD_128760 [Trifolium subterraneum]GAU23772.1 hypothetical protein TSUD_128770 [Trifolium subterraneum]